MKKLRCAIYTRKSSEEGLDQSFNSLHAQREACEAYVLSQAGEGWVTHPAAYDDGGVSGGTMERPGLKQLLADIDQGLIDVVVVYKVDRLTRSLADFAKIVEQFDARSVSFVSVTQAFNTTNSMGRLTLNVLLSFAQFEREVTGERIRDKIAASKAKGMWMGGALPLGYDAPTDPVTRALVVNSVEADQVRHLFERYLALGSVHALKAELDATGVVTAVKTHRSGSQRGGVPYSRGPLYHLLRNRLYLGEIVHRDKSYPGAHPAIIDLELFNAVQASLDANLHARRQRPVMPEGSPLLGRVYDAEGVPMTSAIAYGKAGRKYRYYVSRPLQTGGAAALKRDVVRRLPAGAIENLISHKLTALGLCGATPSWTALRAVIHRVDIGFSDITLTLHAGGRDPAEIAAIRGGLSDGESLSNPTGKASLMKLVIPGRAVFRGGRTWIASSDGSPVVDHPSPDLAMVRALRRAHQLLMDRHASPLADPEANAKAVGVADSFERRLARLAFLAPDIQEAIVAGRHPAGMTLQSLMHSRVPLSWNEQRALLGFG